MTLALNCRRLVLVSTMDGYLTAINAATGVEEWSVSTGITLVSSSISKFEVRLDVYHCAVVYYTGCSAHIAVIVKYCVSVCPSARMGHFMQPTCPSVQGQIYLLIYLFVVFDIHD